MRRTQSTSLPGATRWPCGCVTGRRLCPEAVRLWEGTSAAYDRMLREGSTNKYDAACRAFGAHYARQEAGPAAQR